MQMTLGPIFRGERESMRFSSILRYVVRFSSRLPRVFCAGQDVDSSTLRSCQQLGIFADAPKAALIGRMVSTNLSSDPSRAALAAAITDEVPQKSR